MWLSLAVTLAILLSSPPAEACTCIAMHLQHDYCNSDVVIKGKFLSITSPEEQLSTEQLEENQRYINYTVEILEVFIGMPGLKDLNFKSNSMMCTFYLPGSSLNTEYLITGYLSSDDVILGFCNYIVPWTEVSAHQIKGIQGEYSKGCSCAITTPYTDFTESARCLYKEYDSLGPYQDKNQRCVPSSNNTCIWEDIPD